MQKSANVMMYGTVRPMAGISVAIQYEKQNSSGGDSAYQSTEIRRADQC